MYSCLFTMSALDQESTYFPINVGAISKFFRARRMTRTEFHTKYQYWATSYKITLLRQPLRMGYVNPYTGRVQSSVAVCSPHQHQIQIVTVMFPIDLGSDLRWGKLTVVCLWPATDIFHLKIHCAEEQSCLCVWDSTVMCSGVLCG